MDYDMIKQSSQNIRDRVLREELGKEKAAVLVYYGLHCNERLYWAKSQDHYPTQEYFSHKFVKKASVIGIIFHIYRLCYAKTKYFEKNWEHFEACRYDWGTGIIGECELYEMEFIRHKATGNTFDLRNLSKINRIEDFQLLCAYLESGAANHTEFWSRFQKI
jgi:hypothetical protein